MEHERVPGLVASLDIGILAEAADYQCPLKVIEWMAAGITVVAPDHGPLRELIEHDVHGVLFKAGDTEALARAVIELVDDPERRRRLGAEAAKRAHASMSWQDNARKVVDACRAAADRLRSHP